MVKRKNIKKSTSSGATVLGAHRSVLSATQRNCGHSSTLALGSEGMGRTLLTCQ